MCSNFSLYEASKDILQFLGRIQKYVNISFPLKTVRKVSPYTSNSSSVRPTKLGIKMTDTINKQSFCDVKEQALIRVVDTPVMVLQ
jgi:hypothetical protein